MRSLALFLRFSRKAVLSLHVMAALSLDGSTFFAPLRREPQDPPAPHQPPDGPLGHPPPRFVPLRPVTRLRLDRDFRPVRWAPRGHRQATRVRGPTRVWPAPGH